MDAIRTTVEDLGPSELSEGHGATTPWTARQVVAVERALPPR